MEALAAYLERAGIKQKDFAELAGVSEHTISRFLRGKHELSPTSARRIAAATGGKVSISALYATAA